MRGRFESVWRLFPGGRTTATAIDAALSLFERESSCVNSSPLFYSLVIASRSPSGEILEVAMVVFVGLV